jgi:hypothetical protein
MTQKLEIKKTPKLRIKDVKVEAERLGLQVNPLYDKRFVDTWLYTIGKDVEPVKRKFIVHVHKKSKKVLTLSELIKLA